MRLDELQGYRKLQSLTLMDILTKVEDNGYKLAHGAFGIVFMPPNKNYIYRVWTGDAGYWLFLERNRAHPSPHIVKLIGPVRSHELATVAGGKKQTLNIQKMERLTHLKGAKTRDNIQAFSDALNEIGPKATLERVIEEAPNHTLNDNDDGQVTRFFYDNKSFFTEMVEVAKWGFAKKIYAADMGATNVMQRENGDLVITDPYYLELENEASLATDIYGID